MADSRTKEMFQAIIARDAVLLNEVLETMNSGERADVLASDQYGCDEFPDLHSPLITAVQNEDLDSVKVLLKYKADIEVRGDHLRNVWFSTTCTSLVLATANGNMGILRFLIETGANTNACTDNNCTPLMKAVENCHVNVVTFLTEHGANVALKDERGYTALHYACIYHGALEVLSCLAKNGAAIDANANDNCTPLMMACKYGHLNAVMFLIEHGAKVDLQNTVGKTALHYAVRGPDVLCEVLSCLIKNGADVNACTVYNETPLMLACYGGQVNAVTFLIDHGATVDLQDAVGKTVLHHAVCGPDASCEILSYLTVNGADINAGEKDNLTPLIMATKGSHINVVTFLTEHGANVNLQDNSGATALHYAIFNDACVEILRCVINNGADVNTLYNGCTSVMLAAAFEVIDAMTFLIEHGANVDLQDKDGDTALHYACINDSLHEVLSFLTENGADINASSKDKVTPLMIAAKYGHINVATFLIERGANVDLQDKDGDTALHYAVHFHSFECVNTLLNFGASLLICNSQGLTPLLLASNKGNRELVEYLIERPEITKEQRIDALEYLGSYIITSDRFFSFAEEGFKYIKRGMKERFADPSQPLLKQPVEPVEAYQNRNECQTLEELAQIEGDLYAIMMESLVVRERILGTNNAELLEPIRCVTFQCPDVWAKKALSRHALEIAQRSNQDASSDLLHLSYLLYVTGRFLKDFHLKQENLLESLQLLKQTVTDALELIELTIFEGERHYERKMREETDYQKYDKVLENLFLCYKFHVLFIVEFCEESHTTYAPVLLRKVCRQDPRDNLGNTLLHEVFVQFNKDEFSDPLIHALKLFFDAGLNGNALNHEGHQLLHLDIADGLAKKCTVYDSFLFLDALKLLLNAGFNVNAVNKNGDTPLHFAVTLRPNNDKIHLLNDMIEALLDKGAHHDFVTNDGRTAIDLAQTDEARMILSERRNLELRCISARAVKKFGIPYFGVVPKTLEKYISMH